MSPCSLPFSSLIVRGDSRILGCFQDDKEQDTRAVLQEVAELLVRGGYREKPRLTGIFLPGSMQLQS